jgi:hypothetical protein
MNNLAWTLKSRWQEPRTLSGLREITGTFRSEPMSQWSLPSAAERDVARTMPSVTGKNSLLQR